MCTAVARTIAVLWLVILSSVSANSVGIPRGGNAKLATVKDYWSKPFTSTKKRIKNAFKSKEERQRERMMQEILHMPVQYVSVPNSTVLPPDLIDWAARQAQMYGQPLRTDRVKSFGELVQQWYQSRGYVLHRVTGATLKADTATVEISTDEPVVASIPVSITGCQEMIIDDDNGEQTLLTRKQYKEKYSKRKTLGFDRLTRPQLNTTYVPTSARLRPQSIAKALGLEPGKPFVWDTQKWAQVSTSRVFSKIINATPEPLIDGSVQLHITAAEAPVRRLEYGVGKSLYTDSWEGELEFEHLNILGGGEALSLSLRRGTKDVEPSVRVKFSDDKFGMANGYEVEAFTNYIGEFLEEVLPSDESITLTDERGKALLNRKGATFRFRNPINPNRLRNSLFTASVERISSQSGRFESIVGTGIGFGPIVQDLPLDARQSADLTVNLATRFAEPRNTNTITSKWLDPSRFKPYATVTAHVKHLFPIINTAGSGRRPLILALRHSATTSTKHIPRHESQALGVASNIRGSTNIDSGVTTAIRGTTEIRFPVSLPQGNQQDASIVLFSDWLLASKTASSPFFRKSSVGVGLRKSFQGIPLKFDVSFSKEGKIKTAFGLGADFLL